MTFSYIFIKIIILKRQDSICLSLGIKIIHKFVKIDNAPIKENQTCFIRIVSQSFIQQRIKIDALTSNEIQLKLEILYLLVTHFVSYNYQRIDQSRKADLSHPWKIYAEKDGTYRLKT